jgi:hypothetical protein
MFFVKCEVALFLDFIAEDVLHAGTTAAPASRIQECISHAAATGTLMTETASPHLCASEDFASSCHARWRLSSTPEPRRGRTKHLAPGIDDVAGPSTLRPASTPAARPPRQAAMPAPPPLHLATTPTPQRQVAATLTSGLRWAQRLHQRRRQQHSADTELGVQNWSN